MQKTRVQSLGWEDLLEKKVVDRGAWQATVHGVARVRHNLVTKQQQQREKLKETKRKKGGFLKI